MDILAGKKVLCFIALPHHNRFLVPIMNELAARGMEVVYFTAAAEGAFEITLNQAKLPFRHVFDYADAQTKEKVAAGMAELRPILQERILKSRNLQAVPLVIQDKSISHAVENYHCIDRMLDVEKPDLLFALHEINPWGKILGYHSHVHQIPYFTLQEGLYYSNIFYHRFHTDYSTACLVWGDDCRDTLRQAGCSADKLVAVGNTHIFTAKDEFTAPHSIHKTRAELKIEKDKKVILFLMSHSLYQPFDARQFIHWMKERGDVVAVFKWHPVTGKDIIERAISRHPNEVTMINAQDYNTYALLGASDVCVTVGNSTTGLEALVFGKPLIEVRLPDQEYSFAQRGVAELAGGFEDLGAKIEVLLSQGQSADRNQKIAEYLARNFAHQDAHTLKRIVELVTESLRHKVPRTGAALTEPLTTAYPCTIVLPVDDVAPEVLFSTLEAISNNTPAELFEVVLVNCASRPEIRALMDGLGGDVKVVAGDPTWNYAAAANRAAECSHGTYLMFLKPGLLPASGWLKALLEIAETEPEVAAVGGMILNANGLIARLGIAFDVNQSPFPIYSMLPREFSGARKQRDFRALQLPFLVSRQRFCRAGGFNTELANRFEDIDFCLRSEKLGRMICTPESTMIEFVTSWRPTSAQDVLNRIRFFSTWTGSLWQDDERYLEQDGLTHDGLSGLYQELAGRLVVGARQRERQLDAPAA